MINEPQRNRSTAITSRQVLTWTLIGLVLAIVSLVVQSFIADAVIGNGQSTFTGVWAIVAPLAAIVLLNVPSIVLCLRSMRHADKFDPPVAITLGAVLVLIINLWVILRALVVFFYPILLTGSTSSEQ